MENKAQFFKTTDSQMLILYKEQSKIEILEALTWESSCHHLKFQINIMGVPLEQLY